MRGELPESVRSLIQRKLDALDDMDRRLLSAASVQGMDFDSAIVAGALQLDEEDVETRLERLEREHALVRFVRELETPNRSLTLQLSLRASHVSERLLRVAARDAQGGVEPGDRRAAGRSATATSPCDCLADIAMLFEVARDNVRAAEYWNRAAQAAARLYAHDESARLAQRGLGC